MKFSVRSILGRCLAGGLLSLSVVSLRADSYVYLMEVPDYTWFAGCFGTATGNLMGYWDRHGLPDFYTGPTGGGVAPLDTCGKNLGIRSMWASQAGFDGRPANQPGHIDDYWRSYSIDTFNCGRFDAFSYESTAADPYVIAGRAEHAPDCVGDFIGLSQKKWTNLNNECDGNIDAYSFVYWDAAGARRVNYTPPAAAGLPARDIQSGLRAWTQYRGYDADVFTQLAEFNPHTPAGKGFTWEDLKAEIDAGYPVLIFLQPYNENSRALAGMPKANPDIHGMMAYGYEEYPDFGIRYVRYRTSWGGAGDGYSAWGAGLWERILPVRGFIGYHPKPKIRSISRAGGQVTLTWDGPASQRHDELAGTTVPVHRYQVERSSTLEPNSFVAITDPSPDHTATVPECCGETIFYRVRLLGPGE
jgi:hypothetical protein